MFRVPEPAGPVSSGPVPTFTALIPAYQAAQFIGEALESVLRQTTAPVQILVVDDGSTDELESALAPFASQIELLRVPHAGLPAARNTGVAAARGDFVAFLDADDAWEPEFLTALGALAADRPDLDLLTTDARFVIDGRPAGTFYEANSFPVSQQRRVMLQRCYITTKTAVRRAKLQEIGGFDESLLYAEDWDCWLRLVLAGASVGLVDAPLSIYRRHAGQLSARRGPSLLERSQVLEKALTAPQLTAEERRDVSERLPEMRRRAALTAALESRGPAARRAWLRLVGLKGVSAKSRLAGAVGTVSPRVASRVMTRRGSA